MYCGRDIELGRCTGRRGMNKKKKDAAEGSDNVKGKAETEGSDNVKVKAAAEGSDNVKGKKVA